jgi:hypothetical protein
MMRIALRAKQAAQSFTYFHKNVFMMRIALRAKEAAQSFTYFHKKCQP